MNVRLAVVGLGLAGLALTACGSTSSTTSSTSSKSKSSNASTISTGTTVATSSSSGYGTILTSKVGQTYYIFTGDTKGKSNCTGACAKTWSPVTGSPTVSGGASAKLVGTIARSNGQKQVTYNGHPLYTFASDSGPHQVSGEGINAFGGHWYVISPTGKPVTSSGSGGATYSSTNSSSSNSSSKSGSGWQG
jgi:predicted lipoprotein with Yx(FWY)xxD motif